MVLQKIRGGSPWVPQETCWGGGGRKCSLESGGWGLSLLWPLGCGSQKGSPSASHSFFFFFCPYRVFKFYLFFYFWLCWVFVAVQTFSSYGEQEELLVSMLRLLLTVASLVAQHRLYVHQLRQLQLQGSRVRAQ